MNDNHVEPFRPLRMLGVGTIAVLCGLAVAFLVARPQFGDDGNLRVAVPTSSRTSNTEPAATEPPPAAAPVSSTTVVIEAPVTDPADQERGPAPPAPVDAPPDTPVDDAGSADTTTSSPPPVAADPASATPSTPAAPSYPTLENGTPVPIVVIFDGETIAISGTAPSQAASDRLETLAIANSAVPNASVANFLTINPDVPISVGVRVIEMQSPRFGESSSEIVPSHADQLSRAVAVMNALPNISCVVIGHADQRGDPDANYEISADRAQSVIDYMASQGIEPARLSSRAVGASDLLTLNNDAVALELNRRTEFIFYGLLVE